MGIFVSSTGTAYLLYFRAEFAYDIYRVLPSKFSVMANNQVVANRKHQFDDPPICINPSNIEQQNHIIKVNVDFIPLDLPARSWKHSQSEDWCMKQCRSMGFVER